MLRAYLVPTPPATPPRETRVAADANQVSNACHQPGEVPTPGDAVWARHVEALGRRRNREWFRRYGLVVVRRWACLAGLLWGLALVGVGHPWFEAASVLLAALATGGGMMMLSVWGVAHATVRD